MQRFLMGISVVNRMIYPIARYTFPPFYKLWLGKIEGMENIPKKGPFILALNHSSFYDILLMYVLLIPKLDTPMHALVNSRYWNNRFSADFLDWGGGIPVYVGKDHDPKKNEVSLKKAESYLGQGHILQVFPEGTRSPDGTLKEGKLGIARLAIRTGVPIVPVGVIDSHKVLPKGALFPRFIRARLKTGKPMIFTKQKKPSKKALEKTTRQVMRKIAALIGQRYSH